MDRLIIYSTSHIKEVNINKNKDLNLKITLLRRDGDLSIRDIPEIEAEAEDKKISRWSTFMTGVKSNEELGYPAPRKVIDEVYKFIFSEWYQVKM
ncbi:MAG: hypothetical protein AUK20_02830 [Parcubacteria group bacterium CG2_30_45_37]|nr:MAG: hypothetical protein AUK20_02830 [Parcubacteria group bacterium CG2_30_45_37]